jgi:hypothetical protein
MLAGSKWHRAVGRSAAKAYSYSSYRENNDEVAGPAFLVFTTKAEVPALAFFARASTMLIESSDFGEVKSNTACGVSPALRKVRDERGTQGQGVDSVGEFKSLGRPARSLQVNSCRL